jgi:hypothetical protein
MICPQWFKEALAGNPQAMKNWKALIPSRKKEMLRYIARLKSTEARSTPPAQRFTHGSLNPRIEFRSVIRWFLLDMIDDEYWLGPFLHREFQSELFLDRIQQ